MRVYLAGPMTGKLHYNFSAFYEAAEVLSLLGHKVKTPFTANDAIWQRAYHRDFNPLEDVCDYGNALINAVLLEDLKILEWADAIMMLEGWENSKGTRFELLAATMMNKMIFEQRDERFVNISRNLKVSVWVERLP